METTFLSKPAVTVRVAGYGKHPAWSDHIEGLGTASPLLSRFAGEIYLGAISGLITAGEWPAAGSGKPMATAVRRFLWQVGTDLVFGWMWPSADQVGRDHYPMILCAHVSGRDVVTVLPLLDPLFRDAMADIRGLRTQAELQSRVRELEEALLRVVLAAPAESEQIYLHRASDWYRKAPLQPVEWQRLFYFLREGYAAAAIAEGGSRLLPAKKSGPVEYEGMRLNLDPKDGVGSLAAWTAFLRTQLRSNVPLLLVMPDGGEWCDVVLGTITPGGFKSVLGDLEKVYLVTSVPFDIKPDLMEAMDRAVQSLNVPWGTARSTIFGEVPARFRPGLPAASVAPSSAGAHRSTEAVAKPVPNAVAEQVPAAKPSTVPWKKILGASVGLAVVAGIVAAFTLSRGQNTSGRGEAPKAATNPGVTPPPAAVLRQTEPALEKDLTARWRRYWTIHDQLTNAVQLGVASPGSLWSDEMRAALGTIPPSGWDPWTVVFGGRDKVRGAEVATIATTRLEAQSANLQLGATAAERLLQAASTGYPARLKAAIGSLTSGPAAGLVPVWTKAMTDAGVMPDPGARVAGLVRVEMELKTAAEVVGRWESAWSQTSPVDDWVAAAVREHEVLGLRKVDTVEGLKRAVEESLRGLEASRAWAREALVNIDTNHLAKVLGPAGGRFDWAAWSNGVVGAVRQVPPAAVAQVEELVSGGGPAGLGAKLGLLVALSPAEGKAAAEKLGVLSNGVVALRAVPLVRANAGEVARFRALQADALTLSNTVFVAWSRVATPTALVALYKDQQRFKGPVQAFWADHMQVVEARVAGTREVDAVAAARRWKGTLDAAVEFFRALEGDARFQAHLPSPFRGRLKDADWQALVGGWVSSGRDPGSLEFRQPAAALVETLDREVAGLRRLGGAAEGLAQAWGAGAWTNTAALRATLAQTSVAAPLDQSLATYEVGRLRTIVQEVWSKPLPDTLAGGDRELRRLSALCERLGEEAAGSLSQERWKLACDLAGQLVASSGWKSFEPQQQWFGRLWKARMGEGQTLESVQSILVPVGSHAGLSAWLPAAAQVHQRWLEIDSALSRQNLAQARNLLASLREELRQGRLKDLPRNSAVLDQLIAQKLPENRYDRVDWGRTSQNKPFKARRDGDQNQAVLEFAAGFTLTFLLPPEGAASPILVAREELPARDLALLLTANPELRKVWADQRLSREPALILVRPGTDTTDPYQVWNNVASRDGRQHGAQPPRVPDGGVLGRKVSDIGDLGQRLPANFLSAVVAEKVALALGGRLPTPAEWAQLGSLGGSSSPRPGAWERVADGLAQAYLAKVGNDGGTYSNTRFLASSGGRQGDNPGPFMVDVGQDPSGAALRHWRGNVAEYLRAADSGKYFIAGGSFANAEVEPRELAAADTTSPYIDAGLRLVVERIDSDELGQARALVAQIRLGIP